MPNQEHERERERDQTHSYWYIPSAPRVNYSLLIMESTGMTKMATGEGFPPPAGCRNGSRLVFSGYGGFWRRNSRSRFLSGSLGLYKRCWSREQVRGGPRGSHEVGGHAHGGRARPHPRGCLRTLLAHLRYSVGFFWSKNDLREISGQLDSVWFSFSAILKNKEKTKTDTGSRLKC